MLVRDGKGRLLRAGIAANLLTLLLLAGYVLSQAYPSTEGVRLRNALLIEPGTSADFSWTPKRPPVDMSVRCRFENFARAGAPFCLSAS